MSLFQCQSISFSSTPFVWNVQHLRWYAVNGCLWSNCIVVPYYTNRMPPLVLSYTYMNCMDECEKFSFLMSFNKLFHFNFYLINQLPMHCTDNRRDFARVFSLDDSRIHLMLLNSLPISVLHRITISQETTKLYKWFSKVFDQNWIEFGILLH